MKNEMFYNELRNFLEIESVDNLNEQTDLKNLQEYDSMMIMLIIAFVDENFSLKLTARELSGITTVKSLMDLIGDDKFQ